MNYKIVEKTNKKYIEVKQPITCESDVLDIIGICISNNFSFDNSNDIFPICIFHSVIFNTTKNYKNMYINLKACL